MQVINTNVASLNSQRHLGRAGEFLATSLQRLSSGLRINSAKDDAAGLAISERMTGQIRGMDQARRNANDGVSLAQTGEGALTQMSSIVQRIRELAVQSANATNSASDRQALNSEVGQLVAELDRFAQTTEFNGQKLFNGTFDTAAFQVGANAGQTIATANRNFTASQYGTFQVGNMAYAMEGINVGSGNPIGTFGACVVGNGASGLVVNGAGGSATLAITTGSSARDIAALVNANAYLGVQASAQTNAVLQFSGATSYALNVTGTNTSVVQVSFSLSSTNSADGLSAAVTAFNDASAKTGITARLNGTADAIQLTAADGSSIYMQMMSSGINGGILQSGTPAGVGLSGAVFTGMTIGGQLTFDSAKSYNISLTNGMFDPGAIGPNTVNGGTTVIGSLQSVSTLDVSTVANATKALRIADAAVQAINSQRAVYGALQSRFENTIANLQTAAENLSSARSRIRDTDFAAETLNLTRGQILQQASVAMVAQANTQPNQVLLLLRG